MPQPCSLIGVRRTLSRTVSLPSLLRVGFLLALVGACARARPSLPPGQMSCVAPLTPYLRLDLYMDRSNPNDPTGRLTDEEWQRFVDTVLLKHFPAGGTIISNAGWWRRPDGSTGGGTGRILVLLGPAAQATGHRAAAEAVIREVKQRYRHRSVLREESWVCAAF
jgi:hypothetical protein